MGREDEVLRLSAGLRKARRIVLTGLAGMGKTQLARHYIQEYQSEYTNGCYWLRGDKSSTLKYDFAALVRLLPLSIPEESKQELTINQQFAIHLVTQWLREHDKWLLVVDNVYVEAISTVEQLLPRGLTGGGYGSSH